VNKKRVHDDYLRYFVFNTSKQNQSYQSIFDLTSIV